MSEKEAKFHQITDDEFHRGWDGLASRLATLRKDPNDLAIERLRRRVRAGIEGEAAPAHRRLLRLGAVAAAMIPATLGLGALLAGSYHAAAPASLEMMAKADGSVLMRFSDGRPIRRVVKSDRPTDGRQEAILTAGKTEFVDKNGTPRPGTVVFYRID